MLTTRIAVEQQLQVGLSGRSLARKDLDSSEVGNCPGIAIAVRRSVSWTEHALTGACWGERGATRARDFFEAKCRMSLV